MLAQVPRSNKFKKSREGLCPRVNANKLFKKISRFTQKIKWNESLIKIYLQIYYSFVTCNFLCRSVPNSNLDSHPKNPLSSSIINRRFTSLIQRSTHSNSVNLLKTTPFWSSRRRNKGRISSVLVLIGLFGADLQADVTWSVLNIYAAPSAIKIANGTWT